MTSQLSLDSKLDYGNQDGFFDEMVDSSGQLRPSWTSLHSAFKNFGDKELKQRLASMRRLIRENGVTFNAQGDDDGLRRLWELDPFPLLIAAKEWDVVERGLQQRVRLLEQVLDDVYGNQTCLSEGWLPPELIYGHPGFQRPCHALPIPSECRLMLHSVDLVRNRDGEILVLRDRAETPGGAGYALENRLAITQMIPEHLQSQGVRDLVPFFQTLRNTLFELAERRSSNPHVVFLTPGTLSQTYFEQAYLAQYLGVPLVQGDDLTVRDNKVFLKLLGGLSPVDVIIRRLRDAYCDPLELRSDSVLGVPGLVQAVRGGNVVVSNAIGCGWLETPALHAYLPALCQHFLAEDLILKGVPTWWCGDPASFDYVFNNLDNLVLKPVFPEITGAPILFPMSPGEQQASTRELLRKNPASFVAQEHLTLSTAPCFSKGILEPRACLMRTFVARGSSSYSVMPGALGLTPNKAGVSITSLETGASSKDTWILKESPTQAESRIATPVRRAIEITREGGDIPSRLADNLFWLGRYLERAEGLCRLLRCTALRLNEDSTLSGTRGVRLLHHLINPRWNPPLGEKAAHRDRFRSLLNKKAQSDGLRPCLDNVRRLTGVVRERLSSDFWRLSNRLIEIQEQKPQELRDVQGFLDELLMIFSAYSGLITENTTRSHGWRFLEIGRRLERATHMVDLLKRAFHTKRRESESLKLEILLELADGTRTYRRRYPSGLQVAPVVDLLLADTANPRSVAHQLRLLARQISELPVKERYAHRSQDDLVLVRCEALVQLADIPSMAGPEGKKVLNQLLRELGRHIPALSDHIAKKYFNHVLLNQQGRSYGREVLP